MFKMIFTDNVHATMRSSSTHGFIKTIEDEEQTFEFFTRETPETMEPAERLKKRITHLVYQECDETVVMSVHATDVVTNIIPNIVREMNNIGGTIIFQWWDEAECEKFLKMISPTDIDVILQRDNYELDGREEGEC